MSDIKASADSGTESNQPESGREEVIEGGHVGPIDEVPYAVKHRAETARWLAFGLVLILGLSVALHYLVTLYLALQGKADAVESVARIFNAWLPVISSLVGAAVTYYFARGRER